MSSADQLLHSALHVTAVRYAAENRDLSASIAELREMADGRDDVLAEAAGVTAGSWYASPASHVGHELIAAGMLILAGGAGTLAGTSAISRYSGDSFPRRNRTTTCAWTVDGGQGRSGLNC